LGKAKNSIGSMHQKTLKKPHSIRKKKKRKKGTKKLLFSMLNFIKSCMHNQNKYYIYTIISLE